MNPAAPRSIACTAILLLSACASSPPARYYALSPAPAEPQSPPAAMQIAVLIGPFELPAYLDRPQIVTRRSGNELSFAELSRWAEPLDRGFLATLTADLRTALGYQDIYQFPVPNSIAYTRKVYGRVRQFDADGNGLAVLEVQWGIADGDGRAIGPAKQSHYQSKATTAADFGAITAAMSDTVQQFARDVAAALAAP